MAETARVPETLSQAPADKSPIYEIGFHIVPTVAEDNLGAIVEKIKSLLGKEVEIVAESAPQRMHLAYQIERATQGKREKYTESYFGWVKFALKEKEEGEGVGAQVNAIEQSLRDTKDVLRFILIQTVREDLMQQKGRAVYQSDRLEGQTLTKAPREAEKAGEVSEAELDKSIEALTAEPGVN
jgi:ribosomal protein S6